MKIVLVFFIPSPLHVTKLCEVSRADKQTCFLNACRVGAVQSYQVGIDFSVSRREALGWSR